MKLNACQKPFTVKVTVAFLKSYLFISLIIFLRQINISLRVKDRKKGLMIRQFHRQLLFFREAVIFLNDDPFQNPAPVKASTSPSYSL